MPIKRPQLVNGEIYHIVVRGIASQKTFLEEKDYLRYLRSLYVFNDKKVVFSAFRDFPIPARDGFPSRRLYHPFFLEKSRELLVEILGFCLMPNHIHLLVRQVVDNGISLFLQKMGGYASYFNKKHQRFGSLFQRPFKVVHIKSDNQLLTVINYIHLNPIDLIEFGWKEKGISNPQRVLEFLESFPWSSYSYYLGKENFNWLIDSPFLKELLKSPEGFRDLVEGRVFDKTELKNFLESSREFSLE
ncbi:MAG: transposase [bacterium]